MRPRKRPIFNRIVRGVYKAPPPLDCGCRRDQVSAWSRCWICLRTMCLDSHIHGHACEDRDV
jgi:hypothetical protein